MQGGGDFPQQQRGQLSPRDGFYPGETPRAPTAAPSRRRERRGPTAAPRDTAESETVPRPRDGIADASSAASPGHPVVTFPSPEGSGAPISIPLPATQPGTPHAVPTLEGPPKSSFADPPAPKTQRGLSLGAGAAGDHQRHPGAQPSSTILTPNARPQQRHSRRLSPSLKATKIFQTGLPKPPLSSFFHPQDLVSNSSNAKSHGAAGFICIHCLLTASAPKAVVTPIGSQGNVEADVAPASPHPMLPVRVCTS